MLDSFALLGLCTLKRRTFCGPGETAIKRMLPARWKKPDQRSNVFGTWKNYAYEWKNSELICSSSIAIEWATGTAASLQLAISAILGSNGNVQNGKVQNGKWKGHFTQHTAAPAILSPLIATPLICSLSTLHC